MNPIKDVTKGIGELGNAIDRNVTSQHEIEQELTKRQEIDANTDSWLPKNIRPLTLVILLVLQVFIVIASSFGKTPDESIVIQHGLLLTTAIGFYFRSRQLEKAAQKKALTETKIAERNAKANVEIAEVELKNKIREDRKQARLDRRLQRREARKNN